MCINQISFQKAYKFNITQKELNCVNNYLEKNFLKNPQGFRVVNSDFRVFDDIQKDIANFRFIDSDGGLYILSGMEAKNAWDILFEMMDSIKEAQKAFKDVGKLDLFFENCGKIANNKIRELIKKANAQKLCVEWCKDSPKFSIIG